MLTRREAITTGIGAIAALGMPRFSWATPGDNPVVETTSGPVRGYSDAGTQVFKGIPYGGDTRLRRFMPPEPPAAWTDVRDAFEYGPAAPQNGTGEIISEDCLVLNVWTPGTGDGTKRPVLFYIHGGAYNHGSGSSPLYDGRYLARKGNAVVVTVNHRLNAFGYLYLQRFDAPALADSGNCGQLDLVLALKWVRDNIARFGGDPDCILAFGQSGGGAKIATMMAMPAAEGLFHRAASMSGQQVTASGPINAYQRTLAYLDSLGVAPEDFETLRMAPMDKLVEGLDAADPILPNSSLYFGPVLDMRSLLRHPFYPDAAPQSANLPMIIGNTHDETRAFLRGPQYQDLEWGDLPGLLIPNMRVDIRPEFVVTEYRKLYPDYTPTQVFFAATTAARSWRGAVIEAQERARQPGADTFAYQLDWPSPLEPQMGAPHTIDIPLVFGNLDAPRSITGTGEGARAVSGMMSDAFLSFARTGRPSSESMPEWKPYTLPNRETLVIDLPPAMENDPRGEERRLFARVPYIQPGT